MSTPIHSVPDHHKLEILEAHQADTIVDRLIVPLFVRMGFQFLAKHREDDNVLLFESTGSLGAEVTAVCVRAKPLAKTGDPDDLSELIKSLDRATSFRSSVADSASTPIRIVLISTGSISNRIAKEVRKRFGASKVIIWSRQELIIEIDKHLTYIWDNVDARKYEYLSKLSQILMVDSLPSHSIDGRSNEAFLNAATDNRYVDITAMRLSTKPVSRRGRIELVEHVEEISVAALASKTEQRIALLGDAGSGKSTGLRRIAYTLAQKGLKGARRVEIPIYLRAPDIISSGCSSLVGCAELVSQTLPCPGAAFDEEDLYQGRVRFLVDALDEIAQDGERSRLMRMIEQYCDSYPECKVIITSRSYSTLRDLPGYGKFRAYTIQNISLRQAEKLANNLFKARADSDIETVSSNVLQRIQEVHGMGLNPLLVAVFVSTADDDRADIPANVTELFKKWTEFMLGRWERSKGASKQYQFTVKDFVITRVAFDMHKSGLRSIPLADFKKMIAALLEDRDLSADIEELTYEIVYRSELFRVIGQSIEFRHHLIQEFFAGRGISDESFVKTVIGDDWWRTPIIFYFGEHPGNGDALLRAMAALDTMSEEQAVTATVSLGLALQACYLVESPERRKVFSKVVESLAELEDHILEIGSERDERYKTVAIAWYYFVGRDAVALRKLQEFADDIINKAADLATPQRDAVEFWVIVGLLESYSFDKAARLTKRFRPDDERLLLALDMAIVIIGKLRSTKPSHQKALKSIREGLLERTKAIRGQFRKEIRLRLGEELNKMFKKELEAHVEGDEEADTAALTEAKNESQDGD